MDKFKGLDMEMYIISKDTPQQQLQLYNAITEEYGTSLPFISDPKLNLIEKLDMKNDDVAYRGYAIMDTKGNKVFHTVNDHWGEEIDKTVKEIKEEYNRLIK